MTVPGETVWDAEAHTLAKHEILRRYLGAWFAILSRHHDRLVYIDGFCGPGEYKGGEPGSPIVALEVAASHMYELQETASFLFVDSREDRVAHLNQVLAGHDSSGKFQVQTRCGRYEDELSAFLDHIDSGQESTAPIFAFVDPFGFSGIPFVLIKRLLEMQRTEVFVTFMVDSINRWITAENERVRAHFENLFGTEDATSIAATSSNRIESLKELYQHQLQSIAAFVRYFEMRDGNDRPIYYLFFATNHPLGHEKMKESFWGVDDERGFAFSDATNPDQLVLFKDDPAPQLAEELTTSLAGRTMTGKQVTTYVIEGVAKKRPRAI